LDESEVTFFRMQIVADNEPALATDLELLRAHMDPSVATLVELGCGTAEATRAIAQDYPECHVVAFEVDRVQHDKNQAVAALPNLEFRLGGAEHIDMSDGSVDAVLMLKSLHHVPESLMSQALKEIARVLRPGGLAYISEPVYAGAFNEILRLFHDEKRVRESAFSALQEIVARGTLLLEREIHFLSPSRFHGFADFEARVIGSTHTEFDIDEARLAAIRRAFSAHLDATGEAAFLNPQRADLLRKPG
jgi:SAM-dependent methyltransferase